MINAYLNGNLAEYEKRQYSYTGRDSYKDLLPSLQLIMHLIPANHRLAQILNIQYSYIHGLVDRLRMATSDKFDSLLITAFQYQQQALLQEPYAAYIHNELGNLYIFRKQYDSAEYHFSLASVLSPTWVVPWSNKISMYLALNKIDDAMKAINKTDSLQAGLGFSMVNAGLVMEQSGNWLAAESFYQRAISQNKNQYLPYERLAKVYLNTGNFAKADFYFFESDSRKQAFAVNDRYFRFGQMMVGKPNDDSGEKHADSSCIISPAHNIKWQPYIKLANGLRNLKDSSAKKDIGIKLLRDALTMVPNISLAHHYLGKELYKQGKWKMAEKELLQAVSDYRSETALQQYFKKQLYGVGNTDKDSCLLELLMSYAYDVLEDHYLIASLYEKQQLWSGAIEKYKYISSIENNRQKSQALLEGIQYAGQEVEQSVSDFFQNIKEEIKTKFDKAVNSGGYIKAIRLYESQGNFLQAEKILLNQVSLSRDAGYARQQFIDTANWKYNNEYHRYSEEYLNYFWLNINRAVETEGCNFYRRMEERFPRDYEWKEKAGLFLYNRLSLTYQQIPIEQSQQFYEFYKSQYPFRSLTDMFSPHDIEFTLPGTSEELVIKEQDIDPVSAAISFLEQSIKLSGEFNGSRQTLEMLGDLNSWSGNTIEAITNYNKSLELQPENIQLRNKIINYLIFNSRLPEALAQLEYLYQQNQITHQQKLLLANFQALSGQYNKAIAVISNYQPGYESEKYFKMAFFAQQGWLSGDAEKALRYLNDSLPDIGPESPSPDASDELYTYNPDLVINMTAKTYFPPYFKARLYAMKKDDKKALAELQKAIKAYFGFYFVLEHDSVWDHLRNTEPWIKLLNQMHAYRRSMKYERDYYTEEKGYYNSYLYKIPKYKNP